MGASITEPPPHWKLIAQCGVRKVKDAPGAFELYRFLTTPPNSVVARIHPKAMPMILTSQDEIET